MPNKTTIERLRVFFSDKPVLRAYIFGSEARGEADENSDLDILVELDYSQDIGLEFFGMKSDLEKMTGKKVDLVSANGVSKYIKAYIERDKKLVYERAARRPNEAANQITKHFRILYPRDPMGENSWTQAHPGPRIL